MGNEDNDDKAKINNGNTQQSTTRRHVTIWSCIIPEDNESREERKRNARGYIERVHFDDDDSNK